MAQRLTTEYTKVMLEMTSQELCQFVELFRTIDLPTDIKICDNGDTHILVFKQGEMITFSFRNMGKFFQLEGSYRIKEAEIAAILRRAIKRLKGYAVVHRIHKGFEMVYYYENGTLVKIVEVVDKRERVIYEYLTFKNQLEWIFRNQDAEKEIEHIRNQINKLLDERNHKQQVKLIDAQLKELSHQLFVLEAL